MDGKTDKPNYTGIEELKQRTAPRVVELPGFGDGQPFYALMRRVTILEMAQQGTIPNELLGTVHKLYAEGLSDKVDLGKMAATLRFFAKRSLVQPSLNELDENGIQLTDQQLNAIYVYSVRGEESLARFRQ